MSWDPHIVKPGKVVRGPSGDLVDLEPLDLGPSDDVRRVVEAAFQPLTWTDPLGALHDGDGFSITFRIPIPPVEYVMLEVWGRGNPVPLICRFCSTNGWALLDSARGELVDLDSQSARGWEEYLQSQRRSWGTR